YYKAIDNFMDDVKSKIPILREGVPNRINPLTGEKERYPTPWGAGWLTAPIAGMLTPFESSPIFKDPVIKEMEAVGATFPNFQQAKGRQELISGAAPEPGQAPPINLTDAEQEDFLKIYGTRKFDGEKTLREIMQETMD